DRGHTVIGNGLDPDGHAACGEVDGRDALRLGEGKEGIGHEILRVSWREVAGKRPKQVELPALGRESTSHRHEGKPVAISGRSGQPVDRTERPVAWRAGGNRADRRLM